MIKCYLFILALMISITGCANKDVSKINNIAIIYKVEPIIIEETKVSNISGLELINEEDEIVVIDYFKSLKYKLTDEIKKINAFKTYIITGNAKYTHIYLPIELPYKSYITFENENFENIKLINK